MINKEVGLKMSLPRGKRSFPDAQRDFQKNNVNCGKIFRRFSEPMVYSTLPMPRSWSYSQGPGPGIRPVNG